jgi:hypothetical protein
MDYLFGPGQPAEIPVDENAVEAVIYKNQQNPPNWIAQVRIRLAPLRAQRPSTKAGQIRALWADIEAASKEVKA